MSEPAPTQPPTPHQQQQRDTGYSLSEAGKARQHSALQALHRHAGSLKEGQLRLALTLAALAEFAPHHTLTISARALCTAANLAFSAFPAAIKAIEDRGLITIRHGGANRKNAYQVNFLSTVPVSFAETPPDANKALASAEAALDNFRLENPILDRVLRSKVQDHDADTVAYFRRFLHGYMRKLGRDDNNRRHTDTGAEPHPPDNEIVARLLAVAEPTRLAPMLENLMNDANASQDSALQPHTYGWFIYVALSRLAGIHFTTTKAAEQQFRLHKRGQRPPAPPAAEQTGLEFAANTLSKAIGGVKNLR